MQPYREIQEEVALSEGVVDPYEPNWVEAPESGHIGSRHNPSRHANFALSDGCVTLRESHLETAFPDAHFFEDLILGKKSVKDEEKVSSPEVEMESESN